MLASTKRSTVNSTINTSRSAAIKPKQSFFVYVFRNIREALTKGWLFSRKFMWISSTALMVIIFPFIFVHMMESQNELLKLQARMIQGPQVY